MLQLCHKVLANVLLYSQLEHSVKIHTLDARIVLFVRVMLLQLSKYWESVR